MVEYTDIAIFERAEKGCIVVFTFDSHIHDDTAFERIVNHPPRGIGQVSLSLVRDYARAQQVSMWEALDSLLARQELKGRAYHAFDGFRSLIDGLRDCLSEDMSAFCQEVIDRVGLVEHFKKEPGDRGEFRIENIQELINAMGQYSKDSGRETHPLVQFLADVALDAGEERSAEKERGLMTLHAAKGLERWTVDGGRFVPS